MVQTERTIDSELAKECLESEAIANLAQMIGIQPNYQATEAVFSQVELLSIQSLSGAPCDLALFKVYLDATSQFILSTGRKHCDRSRLALNRLRYQFEQFTSEELDATTLSDFFQEVAGLETFVAKAEKVRALIGTKAPSIQDGDWTNGEESFSTDELQGKVLLLDFWAVWCGPCVGSFPKLRQLHDQFRDRGLVVLGITHEFNLQWSRESNRPVRGVLENNRPLEQDMITQFMRHHDLQYPCFLANKTSQVNQNFAVTSIPHLVLVDRTGTIRFAQVGNDPQGWEEVEELIEELLI